MRNFSQVWKQRILPILALCCFAVEAWLQLGAYFRILSHSPFHWTHIRHIAIWSDLLITAGMKTFPIAVALIVVWTLSSRRTWTDLRTLSISPGNGSDASFHAAHELAIKRFSLIGLTIAGAIAAGSWMQDATSRRFEVTRHVQKVIHQTPVVLARNALGHTDYCPHVDSVDVPCLYYKQLKIFLMGNGSSKVPADSLRMETPLEPPTLLNSCRQAVNVAEVVLHLRETGAMSETEFQTVWAGIVAGILRGFEIHYQYAKEHDHDFAIKLNEHLPMLIENLSALKQRSPKIVRGDANAIASPR